MASDQDYLENNFGVLKAQNARDDLRAKFEAIGTGSYNEWLATAKNDPELARFFEHIPETNGGHPALFSLAAQAALIKERGEAGARQFLADNGGALGSIKPRTKDNADSLAKGARNPWSANYAAKEDRDAAKARIIRTGGTKLANELARSAGVTLAGTPLRGAQHG